jgi:hypothetical protein
MIICIYDVQHDVLKCAYIVGDSNFNPFSIGFLDVVGNKYVFVLFEIPTPHNYYAGVNSFCSSLIYSVISIIKLGLICIWVYICFLYPIPFAYLSISLHK